MLLRPDWLHIPALFIQVKMKMMPLNVIRLDVGGPLVLAVSAVASQEEGRGLELWVFSSWDMFSCVTPKEKTERRKNFSGQKNEEWLKMSRRG